MEDPFRGGPHKNYIPLTKQPVNNQPSCDSAEVLTQPGHK